MTLGFALGWPDGCADTEGWMDGCVDGLKLRLGASEGWLEGDIEVDG